VQQAGVNRSLDSPKPAFDESVMAATPSISLFATTPKASFATQAYILYSLTGNDFKPHQLTIT
jgi:hypothetical protein